VDRHAKPSVCGRRDKWGDPRGRPMLIYPRSPRDRDTGEHFGVNADLPYVCVPRIVLCAAELLLRASMYRPVWLIMLCPLTAR
jgi:hypothetical protein